MYNDSDIDTMFTYLQNFNSGKNEKGRHLNGKWRTANQVAIHRKNYVFNIGLDDNNTSFGESEKVLEEFIQGP